MNPWLKGGILSAALLAGLLLGWFAGKRLHLRMPNAYVTTLVLAVGSLGGPLLADRLLGRSLPAYCLALAIAGLAAGLAFWPMSKPQGEKEWL